MSDPDPSIAALIAKLEHMARCFENGLPITEWTTAVTLRSAASALRGVRVTTQQIQIPNVEDQDSDTRGEGVPGSAHGDLPRRSEGEKSAMTPYEIDILLHYYCRCEDHPDLQRNPPIWPSTIEVFCNLNLLTNDHHDELMTYVITDRGRAYVDALQRVPLPVQVWVTPRTVDAVDPHVPLRQSRPRA